MYLAKNLKYLRLKYDYSQTEIADKTGCGSQTTVSKWETGDANPPIEKIAILSKLYSVGIDDLLHKNLQKEG